MTTPIPRDDRLPQMQQLLDLEAIAPILARSIGPDAEIGSVQINYLRYKPGRDLCVHYTADVAGESHDAVAFLAPQENLRAEAERADYRERAARAAARCPAASPLTYDPELQVLLHWLPFELDLPALTEAPAAVRERVALAGADIAQSEDELVMLQYRPRRRAALRLDAYVAKIYRNEAGYATGVSGLERAARLGSIRTATCHAVVPEWRLTLQDFLPGDSPPLRAAVACDAGALLAEMHAVRLEGLDPLLPEQRLRNAAVSVKIVATVAPQLAARARALLRELELAAPQLDEDVVTSHGDFHGGQLLLQPQGLAVIDFDLLGAAPPAFDIATYAGHLVPNEARDIEAAADALEDLVAGYGSRPPWLPWYLSASLLRRARVPFRNFDSNWPDGVETMVSAAEAALKL